MDYGAWLARQVPNPNRRSRAYARQGPFEGSDRQARGALLRALVGGGAKAASAAALARAAGCDRDRALRLLADLEREGFVCREGARYGIARGEGTS
jgi:A/G-specific adenine glycosylase